MARTCANAALDTITGRRALAPRQAPYWRAVRLGLRVGYRRRAGDAAGTWLARLALPGNRILEKALGAANDPPARADGEKILDYAQAVTAAQLWAATAATAPRAGGGMPPALVTVRGALQAYRDAKAEAQPLRASEVGTVLRRHVPPALLAARCSELTSESLRAWVAGLRGPKDARLSQDRLDGLAGIMGAALRATRAVPPQVVTEGLGAASVGAARGRREEGAARNVVLTPQMAAAVLVAADAEGDDFGVFAAVLEASGLRPVQVANCTAADFDAAGAVLTAPRSAKGKPGVAKAGACHVPLPRPLAARLAARIAAGRMPPGALLFTRPEMRQRPQEVGVWEATGERVRWCKTSWGAGLGACCGPVRLGWCGPASWRLDLLPAPHPRDDAG